jgi:DNA-binding NarL/FixJ family response regulator
VNQRTIPATALAALKAVADGDTLFSSTVTRCLAEAFCAVADSAATEGATSIGATGMTAPGRTPIPAQGARPAADRAAPAALTARETDVLRLVAAGLSNGEIAERLVVSEETVKTHLNRPMAKLNPSSRAQVVVLAYECGLVVPGGRPQSPPAASAPVPTGDARSR